MAYISFAFTLLFFVGLNLINIYFSKPHRGEDGMALGTMLSSVAIGFTISSLILALSIWWKGGFDWISPQGRTRNILVGIGWVCMVVAIFDFYLFSSGWYHDFPDFFRVLVKHIGQIWMPLLLFVSCFYLLNTELQSRVSPHLYKTPLVIAFGLAVLVVLGIGFGWVRKQIEHKIAVREARQQEILKYGGERSWTFKTSIDFINSHKDTTIRRLLSYSYKKKEGDNRENEEIRNAAIAKIKSYGHWESDLIYLLEQKSIGDIYDVYGFIAENSINHPEKFIQSINKSITYVTDVAKESIRNSENYYLWSTNITALCQILESQFKKNAPEFRANIILLEQALNITPAKRKDREYEERFVEILQQSRHAVKNWLEVN